MAKRKSTRSSGRSADLAHVDNLAAAREWIEEIYSYYIDPGPDATDRKKMVAAIMEVVEAAILHADRKHDPATAAEEC